jgi:hypothetical protein
MTVDIVTRRSIAAQILRHKSFSFQEFSQRYSTATEVQSIELRKQGKTNRQSSEDIITDFALERDIEQHIANSKMLYDKLINNGVSRETARDVLVKAPIEEGLDIFVFLANAIWHEAAVSLRIDGYERKVVRPFFIEPTALCVDECKSQRPSDDFFGFAQVLA